MTAMAAVDFRLNESGKEKMRQASIDLGVRVLRAAHMDESADFVATRLRPVSALSPGAHATRGSAADILGSRPARDFSVRVRDWGTISRSSRRSGLRYVASLMSAHRERDRHRGAIALLHQIADDIPFDGDQQEDASR